MRPSPPVNLSGTWSGVIGQGSGGGRALRVTWTATQDGSTASGPATVLTSPPVTDVIFSGALTGKISGSQVSFTLSAQPLPGSDCLLSGTGSAAVAAGTLTGSLNLQYTSCGVLEPPSNNQIVLTKQ
ncbi:MAG TPA: hypothetical protein VF456_02045 [Vicinamibacterales bacterium]